MSNGACGWRFARLGGYNGCTYLVVCKLGQRGQGFSPSVVEPTSRMLNDEYEHFTTNDEILLSLVVNFTIEQ